ncbi:MAG: hypothetical protein ACE5G8_00200 [Anaerolineae bacterium]
MADPKNQKPPKRRYPPFYEKAVPIALGLIVAAAVILLLLILAVFAGLIPLGG